MFNRYCPTYFERFALCICVRQYTNVSDLSAARLPGFSDLLTLKPALAFTFCLRPP